jgi:RNA polymerase II subunit A C-terminal domain phosphatase SSU72
MPNHFYFLLLLILIKLNRYTANKLLPMLERNKQVKKAPERFQESLNNYYDVIFTCEERCFDVVCEGNDKYSFNLVY